VAAVVGQDGQLLEVVVTVHVHAERKGDDLASGRHGYPESPVLVSRGEYFQGGWCRVGHCVQTYRPE